MPATSLTCWVPASQHTVMTTAISGRPARCLANRFTALGEESVLRMSRTTRSPTTPPRPSISPPRQRENPGCGAQWAGQGAPLARRLPAAKLVSELHAEMEQAARPAGRIGEQKKWNRSATILLKVSRRQIERADHPAWDAGHIRGCRLPRGWSLVRFHVPRFSS